MKEERKKLNNSSNKEEVLEFIKTSRTLKRQIRLMRGINLELKEEDLIKIALQDLKQEFTMFKV